MLLFNKEEVYIGYSIEDLSKVINILKENKIKYTHREINHSERSRRRFGSFGINKDYEIQYTVSVNKKDKEEAEYLINKALHP
ncbi:MAG: hypothetical protein LIR50_08150 [Bacillota bacterium]|nr:hypothetical protein [Bacillota bacterium]